MFFSIAPLPTISTSLASAFPCSAFTPKIASWFTSFAFKGFVQEVSLSLLPFPVNLPKVASIPEVVDSETFNQCLNFHEKASSRYERRLLPALNDS